MSCTTLHASVNVMQVSVSGARNLPQANPQQTTDSSANSIPTGEPRLLQQPGN